MPHLTIVPDAGEAGVEAWAHIAHAATRALAVPNLEPADRASLTEIRSCACEISGETVLAAAGRSEEAAMRRAAQSLRAELPNVAAEHWRGAIASLVAGLEEAAGSRQSDSEGVA